MRARRTSFYFGSSSGSEQESSWWERWTLSDDGRTLRELALGRAMQVD